MQPRRDLATLVCKKRGDLTLRQLSPIAGVSRATLWRVENGHFPSLANLKKVCNWLQLDPREFLIGRILSRTRELEIEP